MAFDGLFVWKHLLVLLLLLLEFFNGVGVYDVSDLRSFASILPPGFDSVDLFLVTLASAKRVSELQASFDLCPFMLLRLQFRRFRSFLAYTETAMRSLPRSCLFSLSLISQPACLTKCSCALSGPYQCM